MPQKGVGELKPSNKQKVKREMNHKVVYRMNSNTHKPGSKHLKAQTVTFKKSPKQFLASEGVANFSFLLSIPHFPKFQSTHMLP